MSNKGGRVSPDYLADIAPEYADNDDRSTYNELYKLCWPFIIIKDSKPAEITPVNPRGKGCAYCLNRHSDIVVEYADNEITHVTHETGMYSFRETILTEVYDFIEQCKKFIG